MRPIRLEMQAFGPYARVQKLDFRELNNHSIFLIHGPTGSGKSTILDAICLALYGETTGNERSGGQMRSDYADPETRTRVVFDFALGDDVYRIDRTPKHEIRLPDREKPRQIASRAELWKQPDADQADIEGELVASGINDVKETVERLLGLRADQFRQVVVLPQGRFREMLTASSGQRKAIFSTLFQTGHYKLIEEKLKFRAVEIRKKLEGFRDQQRMLLETVDCEREEQLTEAVARIQEEIEQFETGLTQRERCANVARAAFDQARRDNELLTTRDEARAKLKELEEQTEQIARDRELVERARRAASLLPYEKNLSDRLTEAERSEAERDRLAAELEEVDRKLEAAKAMLAEAEQRKPEIEQQRQEILRLESLRPRIATLEQAVEELRKAEEAIETRTGEYQQAQASLEALQADLRQKQDSLGSAKSASAQVEGLELRVNELKRRQKLRTDLDTAIDDLGTKNEQLQTARNGVEIADRRLKRTQLRYQEIDRAWREGQAAVLARTLADNEPCPVCGSVHHPQPAVAGHDIPDESDVNTARKAWENAQNNLNAANEQHTRAENAVNQATNDVERLQNELGEDAERPADGLSALLEEADGQLTNARKATEAVESLATKIESLHRAKEQADTEVDDARAALGQAQQNLAAAKASLETAEREVPEEFRSVEALDRQVTELTENVKRLQTAIDHARTEIDGAREAHSKCAAQLESASEEARKDRGTADAEQRAFAEKRHNQGFPDNASFQAAKLPADIIEVKETEIGEFDKALAVARQAFEVAEKNARNLEQPDLTALQSTVTETERLVSETSRELGSRQQERLRHIRVQEQIAGIAAETAVEEQRYSLAEFLSGVASGERYGQHRISFETFVQGAFLDDVLVVASEKLHTMTSGQFTLLRKLYGSDGRRSTGLDLEVEDAYTGTARDISTLSGGEGFLAALALALALSEIVQSRAGGIHLDTLFVDEGFGSLDPEALERSLDALVSQNRGRLVGIISHVPELQERVSARLAVRAGRDGSSARFVV